MSPALAGPRLDPSRDLAAPPVRSLSGFQPCSDSSRAGVSPGPAPETLPRC